MVGDNTEIVLRKQPYVIQLHVRIEGLRWPGMQARKQAPSRVRIVNMSSFIRVNKSIPPIYDRAVCRMPDRKSPVPRLRIKMTSVSMTSNSFRAALCQRRPVINMPVDVMSLLSSISSNYGEVLNEIAVCDARSLLLRPQTVLLKARKLARSPLLNNGETRCGKQCATQRR